LQTIAQASTAAWSGETGTMARWGNRRKRMEAAGKPWKKRNNQELAKQQSEAMDKMMATAPAMTVRWKPLLRK